MILLQAQSMESQPQNPELEELYDLMMVFLFIYSLSKDNWPFKLEIVNI